MNDLFPVWLIIIDYLFGFIMSILVFKFILNIFLPENNTFFIDRLFRKITNPFLKVTVKLTPYFIVKPIIPLYIAWLIFMLRIYLLPLLLGYSSLGQFALLFEKDIISTIKSAFLNLALYLNYGF